VKRAKLISVITLLVVITGCGGSKQSAEDFITVDVTAKYPEKELILQDFMDVEYIPLETTDEFICQDLVKDISKNLIAVINRNEDGDIFIFNRSGKGVKKINRKGQGGEEYAYILGITLDEENGEIFVNDNLARKILVYDLNGKFKRTLKHKDDAIYTKIYNFDRGNLICYNGGTLNEQSFMIISKQDGSITKNINIIFKEKIIPSMILKDPANNRSFSILAPFYYPIIHSCDSWIITEPSSDTVHRYLPDYNMTPFIVRAPSVRSMDPEVFLFPTVITDRYCFMETVKKEYDFAKQQGFPSISLMYDRQEKAIFRYTVYNDDYSNKRRVFMNTRPVNEEIATWQNLTADHLVDAYWKGQLKGRLKEIAAGLDEESNSVIMLIKHKK
jgi:hypothetical protein